MIHDDDDRIKFARDARETSELRQQCPRYVLQALDAIALTKGMDKTTYVNQLLVSHVAQQVDEASRLLRQLRGNPLLSDANGETPE